MIPPPTAGREARTTAPTRSQRSLRAIITPEIAKATVPIISSILNQRARRVMRSRRGTRYCRVIPSSSPSANHVHDGPIQCGQIGACATFFGEHDAEIGLEKHPGHLFDDVEGTRLPCRKRPGKTVREEQIRTAGENHLEGLGIPSCPQDLPFKFLGGGQGFHGRAEEETSRHGDPSPLFKEAPQVVHRPRRAPVHDPPLSFESDDGLLAIRNRKPCPWAAAARLRGDREPEIEPPVTNRFQIFRPRNLLEDDVIAGLYANGSHDLYIEAGQGRAPGREDFLILMREVPRPSRRAVHGTLTGRLPLTTGCRTRPIGMAKPFEENTMDTHPFGLRGTNSGGPGWHRVHDNPGTY